MKFVLSAKFLVFLMLSSIVILGFQNCSPVRFNANPLEATDLDSSSCESDPSLCPSGISTCTFNGQIYSEGQAVIAYLHSSVPNGQTCKAEMRACKNGTFTGSFSYATCEVEAPVSCLFNGQTIASGQSVEAYQNSSVAFGSSCSKETRVCNNGELSGTFNFATCEVGAAASCLFNNQTIAHGSTVKAFQNSSVSFGQACISEDRVCLNGSLSGSYNHASCSIGAAASCLFNNQSIPHSGTVIGYASSSVPYGQTCSSQTRVCNNGVLSGNYAFASCSPGAPASCVFNGQTIAHGQNVVAYASSSVAFGSACSNQVRTCNNGVLSGSYAYSTCTTNAAASCSLNGQVIPHGGSVYTYASSLVSYGGSCSGQSRVCNNGTLSGSYIYNTCSVEQCPSGKIFNASLGRCVHPSYGQACNWYGEVTKVSSKYQNVNCELDSGGGWRGRNFCEYSSRGSEFDYETWQTYGLGTCQCYTDGIYDTEGVCYMTPARKAIHGSVYAPYVYILQITPGYWNYPSWPKAVRP